MIKQAKTALCLALVAAIAMASTGCMTGPGTGQNVGSITKKTTFNGFMTSPNQKVYLYGMKGYNDWQYLGQAKSSPSPINHFGVDWYYWYLPVQVPSSCWHATGFGNEKMAVIQARDASGKVLYTFEEGFFQWFGDFDNLNEMWNEKGNQAQSIVIYGEG